MSKAIDRIAAEREVHSATVFSEHEAFLERFGHLAGHAKLEMVKADNSLRRLYDLNANIFYRLSPSATHQHKAKQALLRKGKHPKLTRLALATSSPITLKLTGRLLVRELRKLKCYRKYVKYLRRNKIERVLITMPMSRTEHAFAVAARDLGLQVWTMISSWDNLSSKQPLVIPFHTR